MMDSHLWGLHPCPELVHGLALALSGFWEHQSFPVHGTHVHSSVCLSVFAGACVWETLACVREQILSMGSWSRHFWEPTFSLSLLNSAQLQVPPSPAHGADPTPAAPALPGQCLVGMFSSTPPPEVPWKVPGFSAPLSQVLQVVGFVHSVPGHVLGPFVPPPGTAALWPQCPLGMWHWCPRLDPGTPLPSAELVCNGMGRSWLQMNWLSHSGPVRSLGGRGRVGSHCPFAAEHPQRQASISPAGMLSH
jgi:hypothetical protein